MATKQERKSGYSTTPGMRSLPASYGLTQGQLEAVRQAQQRGNIDMVPAIGADKKYEVPAHEFLYIYHVSTETPLYDRDSGERIDRGKTIKKFNEASFKLMETTNAFRGQKIEILHDPIRAQEYAQEQMLNEEEDK